MNIWLLVILLSMPWRTEYAATILRMGIESHEPPCYVDGSEVGGWVGADNRIHICAAADPGSLDRLLLHESQHLLARLYLPDSESLRWDSFSTLALRLLYAGDYTEESRLWASNISHSGGQELHAELPWLLQGDLPAALQPWYPWFDLSQDGQ